MGSPGGKARPLKQFETLQDAIDFVGHKNVIHVDWTRPEEHMAPIFFLHLATNCLNESKTAHFDRIRIWLPTIFDLRDLSRITGKNVVGGAAFLVSLPSVPWFMLKDHKLLHDDTKRSYCERTKLDHAEVANDIADDEERCVTYYLFIMPEDTLCNANLEKWLPPNSDQRVRIKLKQDHRYRTVVTVGNSKTTEDQAFSPGYFDLRVTEEKERVVDPDSKPAPKESISTLADYFEGSCVVDQRGGIYLIGAKVHHRGQQNSTGRESKVVGFVDSLCEEDGFEHKVRNIEQDNQSQPRLELLSRPHPTEEIDQVLVEQKAQKTVFK